MTPPTAHTRVPFLRLLPFWVLLTAYLTLPVGLGKNWNDTNVLSRLYLASALCDRGSPAITHEAFSMMAIDDSVVINGTFYSNKAPGSSYWLWAVCKPIQFLLRSQRSPSPAELAFGGRILALLIPLLFFLNALGRYLERRTGDPAAAWFAVGALAIGTNAGLYTMGYYGHVLAAILIGWAWIRGSSTSESRFAEGMLLAASVAVEYNAAPPAAVLALRSVLAPGRGSRGFALFTFAAGALFPAAMLGAYHYSVTGNPFIPPFHFDRVWRQHFPQESARLFGMALPSFRDFLDQWFSPSRGILFHSPWLAVSMAGAAWAAWRRPAPHARRDTVWCFAAVGIYAAVMCGYIGWKVGFSTGMRLFIVILPLGAVLAAHAFAASNRVLRGVWLSLATVSVGAFAILGTTFPVYDAPTGTFRYNMTAINTFPFWAQGRSQLLWPHLLGMGFAAGRALMLALPAAAWFALAWALLSDRSTGPREEGSRRVPVWVSLPALAAVSAVLLAGWLRIGQDPEGRAANVAPYWANYVYQPDKDRGYNPFTQGMWSEPPPADPRPKPPAPKSD
jgi:hypothetical protein